MMMPCVIAAATAPPTAMRHAENSLDRADSTPNARSNRTAHHAADRPGNTITFG